MFESWQLRAIREACGWSQGQLAKYAGLTQPTISSLEKGDTGKVNHKTIAAVVSVFESEGFFFTENGIERRETNSYIIKGDDCYLKLLEDIQNKLGHGDEWLLSGSSDQRCSDQVIEKTQSIRAAGVTMRCLVKHGDTYLLGNLNEYRWMPDELWAGGDVKAIYADKVAYLVTWTDVPQIIVVQDKVISQENRRVFEFVWNLSETPDKTTAARRYEAE